MRRRSRPRPARACPSSCDRCADAAAVDADELGRAARAGRRRRPPLRRGRRRLHASSARRTAFRRPRPADRADRGPDRLRERGVGRTVPARPRPARASSAELRRAGVAAGDTVRIGAIELEWERRAVGRPTTAVATGDRRAAGRAALPDARRLGHPRRHLRPDPLRPPRDRRARARGARPRAGSCSSRPASRPTSWAGPSARRPTGWRWSSWRSPATRRSALSRIEVDRPGPATPSTRWPSCGRIRRASRPGRRRRAGVRRVRPDPLDRGARRPAELARAAADPGPVPRRGRAAPGLPRARSRLARRALPGPGGPRRLRRRADSGTRPRSSGATRPRASRSATSCRRPWRPTSASMASTTPGRRRRRSREPPPLPRPARVVRGLPARDARPAGRRATRCRRRRLRMARRAVELAEDKKAADIVLLDLGGLTTLADYFVICSGGIRAPARARSPTASPRAGGRRHPPDRPRGHGRRALGAGRLRRRDRPRLHAARARLLPAREALGGGATLLRSSSSRYSARRYRPGDATARDALPSIRRSVVGRSNRTGKDRGVRGATSRALPAVRAQLIITRFDTTFRLPDRSERLCFGIPGGLCEDCHQLYIDPELIELLDLGAGPLRLRDRERPRPPGAGLVQRRLNPRRPRAADRTGAARRVRRATDPAPGGPVRRTWAPARRPPRCPCWRRSTASSPSTAASSSARRPGRGLLGQALGAERLEAHRPDQVGRSRAGGQVVGGDHELPQPSVQARHEHLERRALGEQPLGQAPRRPRPGGRRPRRAGPRPSRARPPARARRRPPRVIVPPGR